MANTVANAAAPDFGELDELVFDQQQVLTFRWIALDYGITFERAKRFVSSLHTSLSMFFFTSPSKQALLASLVVLLSISDTPFSHSTRLCTFFFLIYVERRR